MALISDTDPMVLEDLLNTIALQVGAQTGDIKFTARATAPTGWLVADGAAVSRTTYEDLYAAIGTAFGAGDGSTTFGLPDLRERTMVGVKAGSAEFGAVGQQFGTKTQALTIAQLAAHNHGPGFAAASILHYVGAGNGNLGYAGGDSLKGGNTGNTGGNEAHNNIQPSLALTPLIKT